MQKAALLSALILLLSFSAQGAPSRSDLALIQTTLGDYFQIYILKKEKRTPQDTVVVQESGDGVIAEISYWRSLKSRDPAEEICNAYRWLLLGRGNYGKGAAEAFNQYPTLKQINVRLFDIEFGTKVGQKRAEILPTQRVIPYLRVGVTRASLQRKKPNWSRVKADLDKGKCAEVGRSYLDLTWFDQAYLRQAK